MRRTVVVRFASSFDPKPVNVNDEINLDPHLSYTMEQHIEDLASDGLVLMGVHECDHFFTDGSHQFLKQFDMEIDESALDADTVARLQSYEPDILRATA